MSSSTSTFKKFAAHAKAHHDSLNAAFESYYSGGASNRPSPSSTPRQNSASSSSSTNLNKTWKKLKEHHVGMNNAFAAYYTGGRPSHENPRATPRGGVDEVEAMQVPAVQNKKGLGKRIAQRAKEHHRSVNAAYKAYYGGF